MKFYSEENMKRIREIVDTEVLDRPGVSTKRVFGCPCYTVNSKLFAFLVTDGMVLTGLPEDARAEAIQRPGAKFFEYGTRCEEMDSITSEEA